MLLELLDGGDLHLFSTATSFDRDSHPRCARAYAEYTER